MFKKPSVLHALIAIIALFLGLQVYLYDRQPEHVYFLFHHFSLAHGHHPLFGVLGNYLPSFVHVYAFILLTVAVAGFSKARLIGTCAVWFVVASLFEVAQHPVISPIIATAVPAWFTHVPILDNTAAYFLDGTFDLLDLLSIALGTIAAYLTIAISYIAIPADFQKGQRRVFRHVAVAGVATLGLLGIIASGGGSSTSDTTPPTVSATNPADAATGVFVDGSISITFSERMDPATVNPTTFRLEDANHTPVLTAVNYAGNIVTFTPINPQPLAHSIVYTATMTTGAKDLAGNALTAAHSWSFTTETDAWQTTKVSGAPTGRIKHSVVWTGSTMIVWGGQDSGGVTNTGGVYDLVADAWSATATSNAPTARLGHTAIWDGAEMIVWGGVDGASNYFPDGAMYDPGTIAWSAIATPSGFVGRWGHTAVWTGTEMIVWGGRTSLGFTNTGAAYDPAMHSWHLLPSSTLLERAEHTAVWTGTEMIVWGGNTNLGPSNDGAAYNPTTNSWRSIAAPPATFLGRSNHTAIWTGPRGIAMVAWGGQDGAGNLLNDGGRYDPATDSWRTTDLTINVPTGRFDHTAVWTGSKMIVWGGNDSTFTNTGGRYTP